MDTQLLLVPIVFLSSQPECLQAHRTDGGEGPKADGGYVIKTKFLVKVTENVSWTWELAELPTSPHN